MNSRKPEDINKNQGTIKYLDKHLKKGLLRVLTCGSVDDGKSTLLGRLLYETNAIFSDQLNQLKIDVNLRAENISVSQYCRLAETMK